VNLARIAGAAESSALDASVIAAGTPARKLMRRAGAAAAARIVRHVGELARRGVAIYTGSGNNGGDGWVVAKELSRAGFTVRVREVMAASTDDAIAARDEAQRSMRIEPPRGDERVIVDAMLGIGSRGAPRGAVASTIGEIEARRADGAHVVALDVPSGLDATSGGADGALHADMTLAFATMKRGLLIARDHAGAIEVLDIGVHPPRDAALPTLVDGRYIARHVKPLDASAHKGTRRKLLIVGGARGMAGAAVLAGAAALRSGVGMVRLAVAPESVPAVQSALPEATAADWPADDESAGALAAWADAIVIGPGLGPTARDVTARLLRASRCPVVLDADAITVWTDDRASLAALLAGRPAVVTPHPAEIARLVGASPSEILVRRFEEGLSVANGIGAVVLLKGTPTVCTAPDGTRVVSASGNAALATAGSGDMLSGIVGTLLAQTGDPLAAAGCAAWVHGRAAELARDGRRTIRGITLGDAMQALGQVWEERAPALDAGVLAALPAAGDAP
jgi:ADP-dependent NAD(P)H-hydrate dehydratase / NAD(P)H-hydrate epimerase